MKNMGGMMKQLRDMQKELVKAQKELSKQTVTAEAADGAISVTVTGDQKITDLTIKPAYLSTTATDKMEKDLKEVFNRALEDSRKMAQDRLGPLSQGLNL